VAFVDGTTIEADVIIWATGYELGFTCLPDGVVSSTAPAGDLWAGVLHRRHPNLYVLGLFEADGGAYPLISRQAELIARAIRAREDDGDGARRLEGMMAEPTPDLSGGLRYLSSARHAISVHFEAYTRLLDRLTRELPEPGKRARLPASA
jgi:hypothetical protein